MKKYYIIILCLLFIAGITSCTANQADKSAPAAVANPVTELESPDFEQAGFKVAEYPTGYTLTRCAVISGRVGEMDFDLDDGATVTFRISKLTDEDISGIHYEFTRITNFDSKNVPVTVKEIFDPSYTAVCTWDKNGYTFSLVLQALEEPKSPVTLAEDFVENVVMEPELI